MVEYADLIGVPFVYNGRGPESYDCYGLVREMWRRAHGVALPDFVSPINQGEQCALGVLQLVQHWKEVPRQPNVMVAFRIGDLVSHCGFMLDDSTFIHAWRKSGGVTTVSVELWLRRVAGFYRYAG